MRRLAWMTFSSAPGKRMEGSGLSLERINAVTSAPSAPR